MNPSVLEEFYARHQPLAGRLLFLVPGADHDNALQVMDALDGAGLVALRAVAFDSASSLAEEATHVKAALGSVSLALGGSSVALSQAEKVIEAALICGPDHINQPFIRAGIAKGRLIQSGVQRTVLNALVIAHQEQDWISIQTSESSEDQGIRLHARDILRIVEAIGIHALKLDFKKHTPDVDWLGLVAQEAVDAGIQMLELSSGINQDNVFPLIDICLDAGIQYVMPHVFSAVMDKETKRTNPTAVRELLSQARATYG